MSNLPTNAKARKDMPICRGLLDYFPDACAAVAELSRIGNDQHNPGEPMHWARGKSMDQADCIVRHLIERGTYDTDGQLHSVKVAWRALALAQLDIEEHAKDNELVAQIMAREPVVEPMLYGENDGRYPPYGKMSVPTVAELMEGLPGPTTPLYPGYQRGKDYSKRRDTYPVDDLHGFSRIPLTSD